jgi:hypothetical protein
VALVPILLSVKEIQHAFTLTEGGQGRPTYALYRWRDNYRGFGWLAKEVSVTVMLLWFTAVI